jgi:cytidine deaminase
LSDSESGEGRAVERRSASERRTGTRRSGNDRRSEGAWKAVPVDEAAVDEETTLYMLAKEARLKAQAPYSRFFVGAALQFEDGGVATGCNIENASYGLTICAERVALVKALSDGHSRFSRIVVVADTAAPTPPCGPCRQLLWEYCGDIPVVLANLDGPTARYQLADLLPLPFDQRLLR